MYTNYAWKQIWKMCLQQVSAKALNTTFFILFIIYKMHLDTFRFWCSYFNQIKWSGTRDGLPWASKLRHVAHLTGCKMLWLAQHPHNTPVNKVNEGQLQNQFLGEGQLVVRYIYDTSSFQTFFQLCRCGVGCPHSAQNKA